MPGHRATHKYPFGKPLLLQLLDAAALVLVIAWVFLGSKGWVYVLAVIACAVARVIVSGKLHEAYERTGEAVRIQRPRFTFRFIGGTPVPIRALQLGFFAVVFAMLVLGIAPMPFVVAKNGMIGCVLGLVVIGILHLAVEHIYTRTGRAKSVEVIATGDSRRDDL
jgi:hypothetical protein